MMKTCNQTQSHARNDPINRWIHGYSFCDFEDDDVIQDVISPYSLDQILISNTPRMRKRVKKLKKSKDSQIVVSSDVSFSCVVKTQRRWSNKIYITELTKTRYNNQVLGKYRVDPQRAGLTLIAELTWSNLGLKGVLNKRK